MELLIDLVVFGAVARAVYVLGAAYGRTGPAGLFSGMFKSPTLDWPEGVQEEDRDRLWSWAPPDAEPDDADVIELGRASIQPTRVQRLRG